MTHCILYQNHIPRKSDVVVALRGSKKYWKITYSSGLTINCYKNKVSSYQPVLGDHVRSVLYLDNRYVIWHSNRFTYECAYHARILKISKIATINQSPNFKQLNLSEFTKV